MKAIYQGCTVCPLFSQILNLLVFCLIRITLSAPLLSLQHNPLAPTLSLQDLVPTRLTWPPLPPLHVPPNHTDRRIFPSYIQIFCSGSTPHRFPCFPPQQNNESPWQLLHHRRPGFHQYIHHRQPRSTLSWAAGGCQLSIQMVYPLSLYSASLKSH